MIDSLRTNKSKVLPMNLTRKILLVAAGLFGLGVVGPAQATDMPHVAPLPPAPV